jgi:hypothetical protein
MVKFYIFHFDCFPVPLCIPVSTGTINFSVLGFFFKILIITYIYVTNIFSTYRSKTYKDFFLEPVHQSTLINYSYLNNS